MNAPAVERKQLVIVGGSGMVGGYSLGHALDDPAVEDVTSIGRKKLDLSHPKLHQVLHQDFSDCSALAPTLSNQDAAVFCLEACTGAVPDAQFRTIAFAKGWVLRCGKSSICCCLFILSLSVGLSSVRSGCEALRIKRDNTA